MWRSLYKPISWFYFNVYVFVFSTLAIHLVVYYNLNYVVSLRNLYEDIIVLIRKA